MFAAVAEGLHESHAVSNAVSGLVGGLVLGLFGIGLLIRFGHWISGAVRGPEGRRRGSQRQTHHGRQRADDVPTVRRKTKDDDPPLRLFE